MSADGTAREAAEPSLDAHRELLWGLCYRMTGSAADADDLVQETFVRALERPPPDRSMPWRPWLVRVAMNLARDCLRRRRRRPYVGQWLPEPIELDPDEQVSLETPEARYGQLESASFAFLIALEALTPAQRAVLLLRDAFDFSVRETARILEMSESNVKTTHHRARRAMSAYDSQRQPPTEALRARVESVLHRMMACIATGDLDAATELLATDASATSDGGGLAFAARRPVVGRERIGKMYMNLAARSSERARYEVRLINGAPALVTSDPDPKPPSAPYAVVVIELDPDAKIRKIHSILNPNKLRHVKFA